MHLWIPATFIQGIFLRWILRYTQHCKLCWSSSKTMWETSQNSWWQIHKQCHYHWSVPKLYT